MKAKKNTQNNYSNEYFIARIKSQTNTLPVSDIKKKYESKEIIVPEFQRNFSYDEIQKSNLITSLLSGLSVDSISVVRSKDRNTQWLCDGRHRIKAICDFINGEYKYTMKGSMCKNTATKFLKNNELHNKYFSEFPQWAKNMILDAPILYVVSEGINYNEMNITDEEVINAVMLAKNSCSKPMSLKRIELNTYLITRPNITKDWFHLNKDFKFSFETKEETLNESLNGNVVANLFKRIGEL